MNKYVMDLEADLINYENEINALKKQLRAFDIVNENLKKVLKEYAGDHGSWDMGINAAKALEENTPKNDN